MSRSDATLEIVAAESGRPHREFVGLPYRLYRGDPRFVAPLRRERRDLFSKTRHPFFAHADAAFFLARRARKNAASAWAKNGCRFFENRSRRSRRSGGTNRGSAR